jgi:hypothetical protein
MLVSEFAPSIPKKNVLPLNWASFLTGDERPVAVVDLTNKEWNYTHPHQQIWEIFGCASERLFMIEPCKGQLSRKELSALETVVLLEGLRNLIVLLDSPQTMLPPPGYERLIWQIDPEYYAQQHHQELLKATTAALSQSRYLKKMWTAKRLAVATANYDRQRGIIERTAL